MDIRQQLENALRDALRENNEIKKRTIRMVLSAIKLSEVEKGAKLDENSVMPIIHKEIKTRKEAIEESKSANRPDLIQANQQEIDILESFLPAPMSEEELNALVQTTILELGATKMSDMGKVMKSILPKIQGRIGNDIVSQAVKKALQ